jgi:hypothetical protein
MATTRLAVTLLSAGLLWLPSQGWLTARADDTFAVYPSTEQLRRVQLAALDCGRDNTDPTCSRARELADPLMDHPMLSGFCKDALWEVVQLAVTAPSNSFQRRETIDAAAGKVVTSCRPVAKPVAKDASGGGGSPTGGAPGSGFGFGSPGR